MSKKSFARLIRIVTGTFGTGKDEAPSFDASLTKLEKFAHFWVLVWQSFVRNRCPVRASALSFTTLLGLIPMLAVAMSISSALLKTQSEQQIKNFVEKFVEQFVPDVPVTSDAEAMALPEISTVEVVPPAELAPLDTSVTNSPPESSPANQIPAAAIGRSSDKSQIVLDKKRAADEIYRFIQNASSGQLGAVGVIFLIWTTIATLTRVEETFNDIWGVNRGRDWTARVPNYFTTALLVPLLCIAALGLANSPRFQKTRDALGILPFLEPLISQLLPVLIICLTFALFYKLVPNTKVHFTAALVGGGVAGVTWHFFNVASLHLAARWVNASKIYGSLALIPLLMLGLYAIWIIVLFGAQVAYAFQNRESYLQERLAENVNQRGREFVALRLMTCIGQRFDRSLPPPTISEMSRELGIPSKLIQQVVQTLLAARLVVEVSGGESGYVPARPLEAINCHHVLLAMRATQGQELRTREEPTRAEVYGEFARIQAAEKEAASAVSMLALVNRAQGRPELTAPTVAAAVPSIAPTPVVTELPFEPRPGGPEPDEMAAESAAIDLESAMAVAAAQPDANKGNQSIPTEPSSEEDRGFPL